MGESSLYGVWNSVVLEWIEVSSEAVLVFESEKCGERISHLKPSPPSKFFTVDGLSTKLSSMVILAFFDFSQRRSRPE